MTRAHLVSLLTKLFGSQAEAARRLNTSRDTISKWGRDCKVPPPVAALLIELDNALTERNKLCRNQADSPKE